MSNELEPVVESAPVETIEVTKPEFDKLSRQDAVKKAVAEHREARTIEAPVVTRDTPTKTEIKQDLAEDVDPPSGFSKEEKEAWKNKDIAGIQKAYRRLDNDRTREISRAQSSEQKAWAESKKWLDLNPIAEPYVKAREKEGVTTHQAIKEALDLVVALKSTEPTKIKEALRQAKIDLDAAPGQPFDTSKIDALQNDINEIKKKEQAKEFDRLAQTFDSVFTKLASQKNRTGQSVFPDFLDNSEKGKQMAHEIGSLAFDPKFQAGVLRRFPDADLEVVVREAYKYVGGSVQGESVRVSQESNQDIERKKRASLSTPAKQVSRGDRSSLIGKLSTKAAVRQALKDYREH